ncbi:MAG: SigmaK-factor processing regulatory BofA [Clostridiaceae bacterium]|nr:SigmaK-factor processing regulatory BofA [Clostridiaceae bacterium]
MDRGLIVLAWVIGVLIVFAFGKAMLLPLKILLRLVINGILGGIAIIIINLIGAPLGFTISLNLFSAFVAGVLGLPGIILLVILKFLL